MADICAADAGISHAARGPSLGSAAGQLDARGVSGRYVSAELRRVVRAV